MGELGEFGEMDYGGVETAGTEKERKRERERARERKKSKASEVWKEGVPGVCVCVSSREDGWDENERGERGKVKKQTGREQKRRGKLSTAKTERAVLP